jgi:hypothetical protein
MESVTLSRWGSMFVDLLYKLARKSFPVRLFRALFSGRPGRGGARSLVAHAETFDHYRRAGRDFRNKIIAEIGGGDQFHTALFFLCAGARDVILVDPRLRQRKEGLEEEVQRFQRFTGYRIDPDYAADRIFCFADIAEIPWWFDGEIDFLCSHQALEHLKDIRSLFLHSRRLLSPQGVSHHKVDLSDPAYEGLARYRFTRGLAARMSLHHLRYSDYLFDLLNDDSCYINRMLLPEYLELAKKYRLRVNGLARNVCDAAVIHSDLTARHPGYAPDDFKVTDFSIELV